MAKRTIIQPTLFQCPNCKKKYFSYQERVWCPDCTKEEDESTGLNGARFKEASSE